MKDKSIDWCGVKTAYVTGNKSYAALALEMNVSKGAIALRAKREKWGDARQAFRNEVVDKVVSARAKSEAKGLVSLLDAAEHMAGALSGALQDEKQLLNSFNQEGDGDEKAEKLDTRAIRNLTGALKDMSQVLRNLYRLPTQAEEESQRLAREKFEFEKQKSSDKQDDRLTVTLGEAEAYAR